MKKETITFVPDGCGYLKAVIGNQTLTYGSRANKKAPYYLDVAYKHTIINSNWLDLHDDASTKKAVISEYKRIKRAAGKSGPLDKNGYSTIAINHKRNKIGDAVCDHCGHKL